MFIGPVVLLVAGVTGIAVEYAFGNNTNKNKDSRSLGTVISDIIKEAVYSVYDGIEKDEKAAKTSEGSEAIEELKTKVAEEAKEEDARNSKSSGPDVIQDAKDTGIPEKNEQEIQTTIIKK